MRMTPGEPEAFDSDCVKEAAPDGGDCALVAAAASGDGDAFGRLVERHFRRVYFTAYGRLGNRESAEDLAQEVFLRALLHLDSFDGNGSFGAWVGRIARNLAEDWRRRGQAASRVLPMVVLDGSVLAQVADARDPGARAHAERSRALVRLEQALEKLSPLRRELVLMSFMEEMNDRQIADRTGMHRTTVRYHREHAVAELGRLMGVSGTPDLAPLAPRRAVLAKASALAAAVAVLPASGRAALSHAAVPPAARESGSAFSFLSGAAILSAGEFTMKTKHVLWSLAGLLLAGSFLAPAIGHFTRGGAAGAVQAPSIAAGPGGPTVDEVALTPYHGTYVFSPALSIEITGSRAGLMVRFPGQIPMLLTRKSSDEFALAGHVVIYDSLLSFVKGGAGEVTEVILRQDKQELRGKRVPSP